MAKGDSQRMQNQIDYQGGQSQNHLNNLRTNFNNQNSTMWNNYNAAVGQGNQDYSDIMGRYRTLNDGAQNIGANSYAGYQDLATHGGGAGFDSTPMNEAIAGYREFAKTGGYSDQDQQNIRARATSPIRAAYANAQSELNRNRALQGGYSPNMAAAIASMAREQGQGEADALTNANANLAQMIQQGKLAGLTGESSTGLGLAGMNLQANQQNNQARLAGLSGMSGIDKDRFMAGLSGLQGMNQLYSSTPGQAAMFGNQLAQSNQNQTQTQGMQNELAQIILNGQANRGNMGSSFQAGLGNASSLVGLTGKILKLFKYGGASPNSSDPAKTGTSSDLSTSPNSLGYQWGGPDGFGPSSTPSNGSVSTDWNWNLPDWYNDPNNQHNQFPSQYEPSPGGPRIPYWRLPQNK